MLAMEEEEDVDPVAATARRVNSLKQAAVVAEQAPAPSLPPAPARSPARPLAPPAPAAEAAGFDAFPNPEEPAAAAPKPSLRALTESKKGAPKKLGDVRVGVQGGWGYCGAAACPAGGARVGHAWGRRRAATVSTAFPALQFAGHGAICCLGLTGGSAPLRRWTPTLPGRLAA